MTMLIVHCRETFQRKLESTMTQVNDTIVKAREAILQKVSNYIALRANLSHNHHIALSSTRDLMN
jgi:hypothetical protein